MNDLVVLYEDNHLLALNKPAGTLVQGDVTGDTSLVDQAKEYLRVKYKKPGEAFTGLIHRLDRPVSGVVLLAKTSKALTRMNRQFADRHVTKCYWAISTSRPPSESGTLVHWLKKNPSKNLTKAYRQEVSGTRRSELDYQLTQAMGNHYLIEVFPKTGRPHQIRAQLGAIGCPIVGDVKYGFRGNPSQSIALHARSLSFDHPVKKIPMLIEAPLPEEDYWREFLIQ